MVDLPEGLIVVFEQAIFYHLSLVFVLNVTHDFTRVRHPQRLALLQSVDEKELELLPAGNILMVVGSHWVILVVESYLPG